MRCIRPVLRLSVTLSRGITTNAGYAELQSDFGDGLFNSASHPL